MMAVEISAALRLRPLPSEGDGPGVIALMGRGLVLCLAEGEGVETPAEDAEAMVLPDVGLKPFLIDLYCWLLRERKDVSNLFELGEGRGMGWRLVLEGKGRASRVG